MEQLNKNVREALKRIKQMQKSAPVESKKSKVVDDDDFQILKFKKFIFIKRQIDLWQLTRNGI